MHGRVGRERDCEDVYLHLISRKHPCASPHMNSQYTQTQTQTQTRGIHRHRLRCSAPMRMFAHALVGTPLPARRLYAYTLASRHPHPRRVEQVPRRGFGKAGFLFFSIGEVFEAFDHLHGFMCGGRCHARQITHHTHMHIAHPPTEIKQMHLLTPIGCHLMPVLSARTQVFSLFSTFFFSTAETKAKT